MIIGHRLVPNTELGHLEFKGMAAEHYAAGRLHEEEGLTYDEWGDRVDQLSSAEAVLRATLLKFARVRDRWVAWSTLPSEAARSSCFTMMWGLKV